MAKCAIFIKCLLFTIACLLYGEYFHYFLRLSFCAWPQLQQLNASKQDELRFFAIADPHLLGEKRGHWFDKLRREWQIYRSYQSAVRLLKPDVVFLLGDLFDEGKWASEEEWGRYVETARRIFETPASTKFYAIVGNHDVGFHHSITESKLERFFATFGSDNLQVLILKRNIFITVNSMGLDDDQCVMCSDVQTMLQDTSHALNCSKIQHFPLYRLSDESCRGPDAVAPQDVAVFSPKHDCVSEKASEKLLSMLEPRLVLSGHTHSACDYYHRGIREISVPSFSWRNRNNPSFLMVTLTTTDFAVEKCFLPEESTVLSIYAIFIAAAILYLSASIHCNKLLSQRFMSFRWGPPRRRTKLPKHVV